MEPDFFEQVLDALAGAISEHGQMRSAVHRGGLKVWFDEPHREHYETQLMRHEGALVLEIGFHAEHPKVALNQAAIAHLLASEATWRNALGDEPVIGEFIGKATWRRVSECWPIADVDEVDFAIEVADRFADYIQALEPCRRSS